VGSGAEPLTVPAGDPFLGFDEGPPSADEIALTFDDGPDDGGYTDSVLDTLKRMGVRATFFVNTDNAIDVNASSVGRNTVERIVGEGHHIGNHTVHHPDLGDGSIDVVAELAGVESTLRALVPQGLAQRLVRAPYGNPYFGPQDRLAYVSPIVARHGVHVGWNIDSNDWDCQASSSSPQSCVMNNVLSAIDAGQSGIVLLHSIQPATAAVLPQLIDALRSRGKRFVMVEELVVAKYGKGSRLLVHCTSDADCSPGDRCSSQRCG
jgi:peptidoglycan/xylan/chitin deacetylase (PgdA/CDA1 family)